MVPPGPGFGQDRSGGGTGQVQRNGSDDEFEVDESEVEEQEREEEEDANREMAKVKARKMARPAKPSGLVASIFADSNLDVSSDVEEEDIFNERKNPNKLKPLGIAKAKFKTDCRRCKEPIRLDANKREIGVAVGKRTKRRQTPPLGHRRDYSIYGPWLEAKAREVPEEYRGEYKKVATWDVLNVAPEHFDCNACAPKTTAKNITTDKDVQGQLYVEKNHQRWLAEAKKRVDGT